MYSTKYGRYFIKKKNCKAGLSIPTALAIAGLCSCSANKADSASDIESELNLDNISGQTWSYNANADARTLSSVTTVVNPEIEDEQGVSVCVPGAYVKGIDTDSDVTEDVTAESYSNS